MAQSKWQQKKNTNSNSLGIVKLTFLNAQSRAMSELRSLIKQFNDLAHGDDERRLKLEGMQLKIEKTKAEIDKLSDDKDDGPIEILIKRKGEA